MIDLEVGGKRERIRPGLHICQFYNQASDISQTAIPFLRDGLRGTDKSYFAASPARLEEVRTGLRNAHVDLDAVTSSGQLQLVGTREEPRAPEGMMERHVVPCSAVPPSGSLSVNFNSYSLAGSSRW